MASRKLSQTAGVKPRLTTARLRILTAAMASPLGVVTRPYMTGFERVAWDRNARTLCDAGWLTEYVHGGFEVTAAGRASAMERHQADAVREGDLEVGAGVACRDPLQ